MDARQKEEGSKVAKGKCLITPSCGGPRRLLFRLRRRGFTFDGSPSLLISNRFGVWSVGHRRYIRKVRHYLYMELRCLLRPIKRQYAALEKKLRLSRWPEAAELRAARQKLADLYWSAMPEEKKAEIVQFYRDRRATFRRWNLYEFAVRSLMVLMVVLGFVMLQYYPDWVQIVVGSVYLLGCGFYLDRLYWKRLQSIDVTMINCTKW